MKDPQATIGFFRYGLTHLEQIRARSLRASIAEAAVTTYERAEGYAFELSPVAEDLRRAVEWMILERRSCPFLSIQLDWPSEKRQPRLLVDGPPGTREFIRSEMPELLGGAVAAPAV